MQKPLALVLRCVVLLVCELLLSARRMPAQSASSLADLRWSASETPAGRFTIVPGRRAFVAGYNGSGLEVWTQPLQLLRGYRITFRAEGDITETDGRSALRSIEQSPTATTRVYEGAGFVVRERIFAPIDFPGATISYAVESSKPVVITVHFTPSLNLMWPAGIGGQEMHWDSTHSAYVMDEPSRRFRGAIVSRQIVTHDQMQNSTRYAEFERSHAFTLRATPGMRSELVVSFAGSSTPDEDPLTIAEALASQREEHEKRARARYASLNLLDVETPDSSVNRALRWAQITLEQAWVCNPQLGCGLIAGYGPSRGARRPQYAWFFAGDGLVTTDALLREGAYGRARDELAFIMRYQNKRTGAIWHEMSQSAGWVDWAGSYPYMFVHVDISFDFLRTVRDYVQTTGDVGFANDHWDSIRAAYDYCRSTIPPSGALPYIPAGKQGGNEQDPQRDELALSLAWVDAAESFAVLARLTNRGHLATAATRASALARNAIRPTYYESARSRWVSGHLRSGAPVLGLTNSLIALLHHGLLSEPERRALLDTLASPQLRAPWGIRSTASDDPLYDPDSYSRGSVWALGTASAVMAFYEGGRPTVATALWRDLVPWFGLDAPGHAHEVLRGDSFVPERESVPDQTWSSAAFLSGAVSGLLGIHLDVGARQLRFAPQMPPEWDSLRVRRINFGATTIGLAMRTSADVVELEVENSGPPLTLQFRPGLANETRVDRVEVSDGSHPGTGAESGSAYEVRVLCPAGRTTRITLHLTRRTRGRSSATGAGKEASVPNGDDGRRSPSASGGAVTQVRLISPG
jgi:glycogen debranching enzyme